MEFVLTLVASEKPLTPGHLAGFLRYIESQGLGPAGTPVWLAPHKAADLPLPGRPDSAQMRILRESLIPDRIDVFINPVRGRRKKLLLADMDSTIIAEETLDELAGHAGLKEKIAPITAQAMRGEIDFREALKKRVALLKGLPEKDLGATLARTVLNPGGRALVRTMSNSGATCVLVSGGFTFFTSAIGAQAGFHHHHGNVLEIRDGRLTGEVSEPILDKDSKFAFLQKYTQDLKIAPAGALAVGDGANDLPMLLGAGLGVGYRPKPALSAALDNCLFYGDLTALLYAQGYGKEMIADAS